MIIKLSKLSEFKTVSFPSLIISVLTPGYQLNSKEVPYIDNDVSFKAFYPLKNAEVVTFKTEAELVINGTTIN